MMAEIISTESSNQSNGCKNIELIDEWENYSIQFTVYDSLYDQDDEMYLEYDDGRQTVKMHRTINP